jgi:hypothetical protein
MASIVMSAGARCDNAPTAALTQEPGWMDDLIRISRWRDASRYYEISDGRSLLAAARAARPERNWSVSFVHADGLGYGWTHHD